MGAGGIGCTIGYALRQAGGDVTMVEKCPTKLQDGRRHGLRVNDRPPLPADFEAFDDWRAPENSTILLCTKCYDNAAVLSRLPSSVQLLPIQNGFDSDLEAWGHELEGIVSFISECEPNTTHTRITRKGKLHLGRQTHGKQTSAGGEQLLKSLVDELQKAALFPVEQVSSITPLKYTKLMYNAAISPLAAAAGIDNGKLLSVPLARRLFFAFIQENYAILKGAGIELGKVGPFHPDTVMKILKHRWVSKLFAWAFEPSLRGTYCSMAPDLPKGVTEIDYYNQRLVNLARSTPCPLNKAAVAIIKRMEKERIAPHVRVLEEFMAGNSSS